MNSAPTPQFAMPAAFAAKEALLAELVTPSLLEFTSEGKPISQHMLADPFFHPLEGIEDIEVAHIPGPFGHSSLLVKGRQGAHRERVYMAQAVTIYVLTGQLLLFLPDHQQTPFVVCAGERAEVAPGLEHGFVVAADCLLYNTYKPAFTFLSPSS